MLARKISERKNDLCKYVTTAITLGIPPACLMSSLSYFDAYRSAQFPSKFANTSEASQKSWRSAFLRFYGYNLYFINFRFGHRVPTLKIFVEISAEDF